MLIHLSVSTSTMSFRNYIESWILVWALFGPVLKLLKFFNSAVSEHQAKNRIKRRLIVFENPQLNAFVWATAVQYPYVEKIKCLPYMSRDIKDINFLREAFKSDKRWKLGHCPNRVGGSLTSHKCVPTWKISVKNSLIHTLKHFLICIPT